MILAQFSLITICNLKITVRQSNCERLFKQAVSENDDMLTIKQKEKMKIKATMNASQKVDSIIYKCYIENRRPGK